MIGSIVHACEFNSDKQCLRSEFFSRREMLYASKTCHRTKYRTTSSPLVDRTPVALVWTDTTSGAERLVRNIEAIYALLAELYMQAARRCEQLNKLRALLDAGFDVCITGDTDTVDDSLPNALRHEMLSAICWERVLCEALNANR